MKEGGAGRSPRLPGREGWALWALALILTVTVGWWAAALWPLPAATPDWVVRARAACFGSTESGLPDSGGWILLVGTPVTMLVALLIIAGGDLRAGMGRLWRSVAGRAGLVGAAVLLAVLAGAAGLRVSSAYGYGYGYAGEPGAGAPPLAAEQLPRLAREAPPLELIDQHGARVELEAFRGRPVLVTFAFGKCETICPVIVHQVLSARAELSGVDPAVLIVTVDPWRDTPTRLPHIAAGWGVEGDVRVLGGAVEEVEATLDAWGVERSRDPRTGDVVHPSLAYVLDREGRIAFAVTGSASQIVGAVRRL